MPRFVYFWIMTISRFGGFRLRHFFCLLQSLLFSVSLAQPSVYQEAEASAGIRLGRTRPLYLSELALPTDSAKLAESRRFAPVWVPNFAGRRHEPPRNPNAQPTEGDPLFHPEAWRMPTFDIPPVVNIEGMSESVSTAGVPDVNGEIGRDYYVQMVNVTYFRVFDKMGNAVSLPIPANTIWNQVGLTSFGDPILLYDQQVDRWLLTEFASVGARTVLVAISDSPDPRGTWTAYKFQTPRFPDFPKYGIWQDAYYFTANETGGTFPIYAINREDMLAGKDTVRFQRLTIPKIGGVGFEVGQPVDWDGLIPPPPGSPMILVKMNDDAWGTTPQDAILLHRITIDWANSSNSKVTVESVPTTPYDSDGCQLESTGGFSCIPQPNGQGIDGGEWIITNKAVYRNFIDHESFVMAFLVDVDGNDVGGIRWIEFQRTPTREWYIYQEGTVGSLDGLHRFMPAIAIDAKGNIGLGYGVSGYAKSPSLRYTGRYASDPPGMMTFTEYEIASGGGSWGSDRFGDYFSMSVDPADESTFWFTGEYIPANGVWTTRIAAFAALRDTLDLLPVSLVAPVSSPDLSSNEIVVLDVLNRGIQTVDTFAVAYQLQGGDWIIESATDSLPADSTYRHTFSTPAAFPAPGPYAMRVAVLLSGDGNSRNDTMAYTITKYPFRDLVAEYVPPAQADLLCGDQSLNTVRLLNGGLDTLFEADLILSLNGSPIDTIHWSGRLAFGETEQIDIPAMPLMDGMNQLALEVLSINGVGDEIPANSSINWTLSAKPEGEPVFLSFRTDNFPQESSWKLRDAQNEVIAEGGPFGQSQTVYHETFCLDPNTCYTFTVYDAFGDGMSAQGVTGDFEITNSLGEVIAELARPNFGAQISSQFCLADTCLLVLNGAAGPSSAAGESDGFIMAMVANGLGIVQYSLDGGQTFQVSPLFTGLQPGNYTLTARDAAGCTSTTEVIVGACTLDVLIATTPAAGGNVGTLTVLITGAKGTAEVKINNGEFVADTVFTMLEAGEYAVTVRDSLGCSWTDTVTVSSTVSTVEGSVDEWLHVAPNPGQGLFDLTAQLNDQRIFIPMTIYAADGEPVLSSSLVRFNDLYRGQVVLERMPPGIYYVAVASSRQWIIRRLVSLP